jgi:hypothetical protein
MLNKVNIRIRVHKKLLGCFIMRPTIVTVALSSYIHIQVMAKRMVESQLGSLTPDH